MTINKLRTLLLTFGMASSAGLSVPASAETCLDLNGDGSVFQCTPNPNNKLTCPTSSPTNAEMAVSAGVSASCPKPPPAGGYVAGDLDARVRDILVYSAAMQEDVWVRVILPPSFSTGSTFPVLYLLTGNGASYQSWTCNTLVQNYLANTEVLVVMPDASRYNRARCARPQNLGDEAIPGWYSDWTNPSADGNPEQWEQFHTEELPALLQSKYKASGVAAFAGLSMGGYGAIKYASNNLAPPAKPFTVVAAASYSGMLNTVSQVGFTSVTGSLTLAGQDTNALWSYYPGTPYANAWGSDWPENNPAGTPLLGRFVTVDPQRLSIPLFIAAGDGTLGKLVSSYDASLGAIEFGAKSTNQNFVAALKSANGNVNAANLTIEFYKGTHQWRYWDAELCRSLNMLMPALGFAQYKLNTPGYVGPALPCRTPF